MLMKDGKLDEALECFDRAIALNPDNVAVINNRAIVLQALNRHEESLEALDEGLLVDPVSHKLLTNRGTALRALERRSEAMDSYDRALASKSDSPETLNNRGALLEDLCRYDEALEQYAKAIEVQPDFAKAHFNAGMCRLRLGDFEAGWKQYEWRWKCDDFPSKGRNYPRPLWLGTEDVTGKTVLLHAEQGLGDTIQFCRYATELSRSGATVILAVQPPLISLVADLPGVHKVLTYKELVPDFDFHCPLMSLPLAFKNRIDCVPAPVPYLHAPEAAIRSWTEKLSALPPLSIGLAWSGNARHKRDSDRSIALEKLLVAFDAPGIGLFSLQDKVRDSDSIALEGAKNMLDFGADLRDFSDTAALISKMDLVITVDTAVAHLAGAMGKPVWILLAAHADWRWMENREDSPWYPSARLFRQRKPGDWDGVIHRVRQALAGLTPAERH
jgi:tetratricopeptide (TPR) repeat protein